MPYITPGADLQSRLWIWAGRVIFVRKTRFSGDRDGKAVEATEITRFQSENRSILYVCGGAVPAFPAPDSAISGKAAVLCAGYLKITFALTIWTFMTQSTR